MAIRPMTSPSTAPVSTSSATCWRMAMVDQTIRRHQAVLMPYSQRGAPTCLKSQCSHTAVRTENATWSDGQALWEVSAAFKRPSKGQCAQSTPGDGPCVGQKKKMVDPTRLNKAAEAM